MSMIDVPLFEGYEPPEPVPASDLSPGRRLTLRQAAMVAAGVHPLTRRRIHLMASKYRDAESPKDDPFTCGSCYFRQTEQYHDRSYPKCWLPGALDNTFPWVTHGPASDVRAWWPACPDYSPGDSLSPDAARSIPEAGN